MSQAEAIKKAREVQKAKREEELTRCKFVVDWSNLPMTQQILKEIKEQEENIGRHILSGGCKDYTEYLSCVLARKKATGLPKLIEKYKNLYDKIEKDKIIEQIKESVTQT